MKYLDVIKLAESVGFYMDEGNVSVDYDVSYGYLNFQDFKTNYFDYACLEIEYDINNDKEYLKIYTNIKLNNHHQIYFSADEILRINYNKTTKTQIKKTLEYYYNYFSLEYKKLSNKIRLYNMKKDFN